jgi:basic membrane protein A
MKRSIVVLVALSLLLVVVGLPPAGAAHGVNGKVCVVEDIGGGDDPFSEAVAEGTKAARSKFHVDIETLHAATQSDIANNIVTFVNGDCDLIVGLGFIVGFEMEPFVDTNPDQLFAVIDHSFFGGPYSNAAEVNFLPNEAAFLAGYIAAGISETGKVGVFGGIPVPGVTVFMDGYALGVERFNAENGAGVEVLGWDPSTQTGLFTFNFDNPADGQATASDLFDQGADTVFPVAGATSLGALDEAALRKAAGESVRVIGVDYDWVEVFGDRDRVILTSVVKDWGVAVFNQIAALVDGTWTEGLILEGLGSGGVDIAPFHKLNRAVPGYLKNDLKAIRAGIIDGSIPTLP